MKIARSFTGFLSSNPRKWDLLRSTSALRSLLLPTEVAVRHFRRKAPEKAEGELPVDLQSTKDSSELPRPSLIPFQAKVANSVNIVGTIGSDVKLHQLSDGSCASVLTLVNGNTKRPEDFSLFMIPVVFQGDLAEIAACHLKKNDLIYVSGRLTGDNLPFIEKDIKANIKLIAQSVNYVTEALSQKRGQFAHKQDEVSVSTSDSGVMKTSDNVAKPSLEFGGGGNSRNSARSHFNRDQQWKRLVENPEKWWDNRLTKLKPTQPDFKHKDDGEGLWLNSAPSWALSKLPPLPAETNAVSK